jgi:Family of unknown function (DUF5906)
MNTIPQDTAAPGTWPPDIPPRAEPHELALGGGPADDEVACNLLYDLIEDYRYATDLRQWIVRDGDRWVPAEDGIIPFIAACASRTELNPVLDSHRIRKWERQGYPGRSMGWTASTMEGLKDYKFNPEDVKAQRKAQQLRTPAGQARLAALMKSYAATEEDGVRDPLTVRTDQLDSEPGVLWAGSVPFDLARSVREPAWMEDCEPVPPPSGLRGKVFAFISQLVNGGPGCGIDDIAAEFSMSRKDASWWLAQFPDDYGVEGQTIAHPWPMSGIPHMMSCNYCPDIRVPTPRWDELTATVFPDPAEREHALNALAHGLHGWPTDTAILARAATGTGKSLIASLISDLLGSYAGQVAASTLFGKSGNAQFAFDEMAGARFVVMSEGRKASFQATEAFKAVVSPDPLVNARPRHGKHRKLVPGRHTLFLTVNPAADLDYSDPAVVRRLVPAGFTGDPEKLARLTNDYGTRTAQGTVRWKAEAPGVLAQMIVRCAYVLGDPANRGTRADAPVSVMSRFEDVAAEADPWGRWLAERTGDGRPTPNDDLYADYLKWCEARTVTALNPTHFGRAMASAGIERTRLDHGTIRGWRIALR